ncbi:unnamed protein product [Calypogeia fissa]
MGVFKRNHIRWTESARLQLVEAVIEIDQLMESSPGLIISPSDKWTRIANRLPVEFRGKVWSNKTQTLCDYKCKSMFVDLLKVYYDKLAGKSTAHAHRRMTKAMKDLIKKREDLLRARSLAAHKSNSSFKSAGSDGITTSRSGDGDGDQRQHRSQAGRANSSTIRWTEAARLHVIGAVMHIEKEDMVNGSTKHKWDRIVKLLPHKLRERTWSYRRKIYNNYKCQDAFQHLLTAFRAMVSAGGNFNHAKVTYGLTRSVFDLLKKRQEILEARKSSRDSFGSGEFDHERVTTSVGSESDDHDHQQLSPTYSDSCLNMQMEQRLHLLEPNRSRCTAIERAATFSSDSDDDSDEDIADGVQGFDSNAVESTMNHIIPREKSNSIQTNNMGLSLQGYGSRSSSSDESSGLKSDPELSSQINGTASSKSRNRGSSLISISPQKYHGHVSNLSTQEKAQTRGQNEFSEICTRPDLTSHIRASGSERGSMEVPVRRLELEFSHLSSSITFGRKMMHDMTCSALKSYVTSRRRMNAADISELEGIVNEPIDELIERSSSGVIASRIRSAAHQFAGELKDTAVDIAQEIFQEFYSHPSSDHDNGAPGAGQSPLKKVKRRH